MEIKQLTLGVMQTNCYLLYEEEGSKVICIDPADKGDLIYRMVTKMGKKVGAILLTHGHFDHIAGAKELSSLSGAKIYAHVIEKETLENSDINLSYQFMEPFTLHGVTFLADRQEIKVNGLKAVLLFTPGHTQGGCSYYFEQQNVVFSGDTLFCDSVGRTDFPTGSASELKRSIVEQLFTLPEETIVYPGHGESTTIDYEKKYNAFCC